MKKLICLFVLFHLLIACGPTVEGELRGVKNRGAYYPEEAFGNSKLPFGMVYIQSGAFQTGDNDQDIMGMHTTQNKTFSVPAFYMDATEISNNEYRQFIHWVRDSIAREKLYRRQSGEEAADWINIPDHFFKEPYRTLMNNGSDIQGGNTPFQKFSDKKMLEKIDKTYLSLMGNDNHKTEKLINNSSKALDIDDIDLKGDNGKKIIISVEMTNDHLKRLLECYDETDSDIKNEKFKESKYEPKKQGGRIENRKYFTLNWEKTIDYKDATISFLLSDMYLSESERFMNRKEIDTRLLFYDYYWIDFKEAARRGKISASPSFDDNDPSTVEEPNYRYTDKDLKGIAAREPLGKDRKNDSHRSTLDQDNNVWLDTTVSGNQLKKDTSLRKANYASTILENPGQDLDLGYTNSKGQHNAIRGHTDRSRFIIKERINIYPDTLCWLRDNTFSNAENLAKSYFYSNAYDNYPVVGVTWPQAKAFSVWRTQIFNTWLQSNGDMFINDFRLPSESEWERAARGDMDMMEYPWGGPYIRNSAGCFQANFKPMRGRYFEDGGMTTVKVYSYHPNSFGLYCMAGNVAEWCSSTYDESSYEFQHDMSAEYDYQAKDGDPITKKRKVVRGGSWKDIGYYLLNTTRTYEYQDSAKNYIGFRNVMSFLGRGGKDIDKENGEEIQSDIQLK